MNYNKEAKSLTFRRGFPKIRGTFPDIREDPKSRSPNLGPYTRYFIGTPIKGSSFWILPGVWVRGYNKGSFKGLYKGVGVSEN